MKEEAVAQDRSLIWAPPRRPWEIEVVILLFVLVAVLMPFYIAMLHAETAPVPQTLMEKARTPTGPGPNFSHVVGMLWGVGILGAYLMHLTMGTASITFNTTPAYYLVSPLFFGGLAYFRLYQQQSAQDLANPLVTGTLPEILLWFLVVVLATTTLARMRMLRHRIRFRTTQWDITSPAHADRTFLKKLAWLFRPLLYPPRRYRACPDGILIEGWLYLCPIPFTAVEDVEHVEEFHSLQQAEIYASSARNMVQIVVSEQPQPILISPRRHEEFLHYCREQMGERLHVLRSKTMDVNRMRSRDVSRVRSRSNR